MTLLNIPPSNQILKKLGQNIILYFSPFIYGEVGQWWLDGRLMLDLQKQITAIAVW